MEVARRIHIYLDGYGWSEDKKADLPQLRHTHKVSEIPPVSKDAIISFFNASDGGDLEFLQDSITELRHNLTWSDKE